MNHELRVALCHSITARAHLAGAEAAELDARATRIHHQFAQSDCDAAGIWSTIATLYLQASAARRRYWREQEACELLHGRRWPEAEALGVEP